MRAVLLALVLLLTAPSAGAETLPFVPGSYGRILDTHRGKPLVVHFWSLTCAPCLAELPQWTGWSKSLGFTLVLVSTDPLDQASALEARLKRAGLQGVQSYAFADDFSERLLHDVDKSWRGELPLTHVVRVDGHVAPLLGTIDEMGLAQRLGRVR